MSDVTPVRDPKQDSLLTPSNAVLALIDYQPEQYAGVGSIDPRELVANVTLLGRLATAFQLPVVLSTVCPSRCWDWPVSSSGTGDGPGRIAFAVSCAATSPPIAP